LLLAVLAFIAYGVLHQDSFYAEDGNLILMALEAPSVPWGSNAGSIWLLRLLCAPLRACGIGTFTAAELASGLCTAAAVFLAHRAAVLLGLDRQRAWLAAALLAANPPTWFFATIIEYHGPLLPFACLSFVAMLAMARRRTALSAAACGASSALAHAFHQTGFALPGLLLPCFLVLTRGTDRRARRDAWLVLLALATHLVLIAAGTNFLSVIGIGEHTVAAPWQDLVRIATARLHLFPLVLWREWIAAHVPLSVAMLCALLIPAWRGLALATLAGVLTFVALTTVVLGDVYYERGSYLIPLAVPAALLTAATLKRPVAAVLLAVSLFLATKGVLEHDVKGEWCRAFVAGVRAVAGEREPYLALVWNEELGAIQRAELRIECWNIRREQEVTPQEIEAQITVLGRVIAARAERGYVSMISRRSLERLEDPHADVIWRPFWPVLARGLRKQCTLEPVHAAGFDGFVLHAR
jgi:hypothetical protein